MEHQLKDQLTKGAEQWKSVHLDDSSMWPTQGVVPLEPAHRDSRGAIQPLVNFPVKNVSLISSQKGTVRSNHFQVETNNVPCWHSFSNHSSWPFWNIPPGDWTSNR